MAKVFVIAGHGACDPGACGNGYQEAERVRALANRIKQLGGSSVMLADTSRNWYADKGINSLSISKEYQILELHMDSGPASARGGHVIINGRFKADDYDTALAKFISGILPGRSKNIVGRTDLANVNRAAAKGYSYRLMECGFISNSTDVKIFNSKMDEIAKGILNCFGIVKYAENTNTSTTPNKPTSNTSFKPAKLTVDGIGGPLTIKRAQAVFGTTVDGIISNQFVSSKPYIQAFDFRYIDWDGGAGGSSLVKAIQKWAGATVDGYWGVNTTKAVQKKLGVTVDGYFGPISMKAFQTWLNTK